MLYTPGNSFAFSVDNFGATYTDAGIGTNAPGHANANTKGANTAILSAIAEDCYGLSILFSGGSTAATIRRALVDVLIDPAGGTSWSVLIANLLSCGAGLPVGGYWYYFPIFLKAGTALGAAHQDLVATTQALRVGYRVFGRPSRPELLRVGSNVTTFGAVTATTTGTAFTPGTSVVGALSSSLGTLTRAAWWWQCGFAYADTNVTASALSLDVLAGDGTNNKICMRDVPVVFDGSERYGMSAMGSRWPMCDVASGSNVYLRGSSVAAPETTPTGVIYALGG